MLVTPENAEVLALQVLGWLVANEDLLPVFLGASGASEKDIRRGASDPAFLGAVLDFLLMDDAWVMAFCQSAGLNFEAPQAARAQLPGGQHMSWT